MYPNKKNNSCKSVVLLLLAFMAFAVPLSQAQTAQSEGLIWAVTASNKLISFSSLTPGTLISNLTITGLPAGDTVRGIDFRPKTGLLYAVSSSSRIFTINTATGAATQIGTATFTPALNGTAFGVDFNPVPDRIRLVSDADQNLRLQPDTGVVAGTDTALAFATGDANAAANPNVISAAYTNNINGAVTTTLYAIDSNLDILVRQGSTSGAPVSPNTGQLFTIGALGVNTTDQVGFDIADFNDTAFASLTTSGATQSQLYTINLTTGAATAIGTIGLSEVIRDIAVAPTFTTPAQQYPIAVVNGANFFPEAVAADSIASVFGAFVTTDGQSAVAVLTPLPTTLNGITVSINGVNAPLFYVSNSQINILIPTSTAAGAATVVVTSSNATTRTGVINILPSAPGLFSVDSTGTGSAIAQTTTDGLSYQSTVNADGSERPIAVGSAAQPTYLILYGTGIRNAQASNPADANGVGEAVIATVQGVHAAVAYAGMAPGWVGLDQVNVIIPPELTGLGKVTVKLLVNGQVSNVVTITLGGNPPIVKSQPITPGQLIAGQLMTTDQLTKAGDGSGRTYFFDAYSFTANAQTGLALDVRSKAFDAAALLYRKGANGALTLIAADDDLGGLGDGNIDNSDALLLTVVAAGDYVLFVTSADDSPNAVGGYSVKLLGNAVQPLSYGANLTNANIGGTDLRTSGGTLLDAYWFAGVQSELAQIKMSSTSFDSFLLLNTNDGETIATDDNGGGGLDAQISKTLPASGIYVVIATPFALNATGNYSLTLDRGAALTLAENSSERAVEFSSRHARLNAVKLTTPQRGSSSQTARFATRFVIEK